MKTASARDSLATKKLLQALARLQPNQGAVARRRARRSVGACIAALKASVDDAFPLLNTKRMRKSGVKFCSVRRHSPEYAIGAKVGYRVRINGSMNVPQWIRDLVEVLTSDRSARVVTDIDLTAIGATSKALAQARSNLEVRAALFAAARLRVKEAP